MRERGERGSLASPGRDQGAREGGGGLASRGRDFHWLLRFNLQRCYFLIGYYGPFLFFLVFFDWLVSDRLES